MDKAKQLRDLLDGCDVVTIDIINTSKAVENETSSPRICLVSGIPENDKIIAKIREALC